MSGGDPQTLTYLLKIAVSDKAAAWFKTWVEPSQLMRNATKEMIPSPTQEIQK